MLLLNPYIVSPAGVGIDPDSLDASMIAARYECDYGVLQEDLSPAGVADEVHKWLDRSVNGWDLTVSADKPASIAPASYSAFPPVYLNDSRLVNASINSWNNVTEFTWLIGTRRRSSALGHLIWMPGGANFSVYTSGFDAVLVGSFNYAYAWYRPGDFSLESIVLQATWDGNAPNTAAERNICYINGDQKTFYDSGGILPASTNGYLGNGLFIGNDNIGSEFVDQEVTFMICLLTADQETVQGVADFYTDKYYSVRENDVVWIFEGDSLTTGYPSNNDSGSAGVSNTERTTPSSQFGNLLDEVTGDTWAGGANTYAPNGDQVGIYNAGAKHTVRNFAAIAEQISPIGSSPMFAQQFAVLAYRDELKKHSVMPMLAGTNDLFNGVDAATTYAALVSYWQDALSVGVKIIATTVPDAFPEGVAASVDQATFDAERAALNALIRANALDDGAFALDDLDAYLDSVIPETPYRNSATYFEADKVHFTYAGNTLRAESLFATVLAAGLIDTYSV